MKLCRFLLHDSPEVVRSGIFHENRVYETVGEQAAGIHSLSQVRFLSPIGRPPNIRLAQGASYEFSGTGNLLGPLDELVLPDAVEVLDIEIRVAAVIRDAGTEISLSEAPEFILGYTNFVRFVGRDSHDSLVHADIGSGIGPFLHTTEEFPELDAAPSVEFGWDWELKVNQESIHIGRDSLACKHVDLITRNTRTGTLSPGDLVVSEPLPMDPIRMSSLGRGLATGDQLQVSFARLGTLTLSIG